MVAAARNTPTAGTNFDSGTNRFNVNNYNGASYDRAGNLTTVNGNGAIYNLENQMTGVSGTGIGVSILYDGAGQRVQKTVNGTTTTYVYDAFGLAAEYVNGSWAKDYVRDGGGNLVATENASGPCATCNLTTKTRKTRGQPARFWFALGGCNGRSTRMAGRDMGSM